MKAHGEQGQTQHLQYNCVTNVLCHNRVKICFNHFTGINYVCGQNMAFLSTSHRNVNTVVRCRTAYYAINVKTTQHCMHHTHQLYLHQTFYSVASTASQHYHKWLQTYKFTKANTHQQQVTELIIYLHYFPLL